MNKLDTAIAAQIERCQQISSAAEFCASSPAELAAAEAELDRLQKLRGNA